MNDSERTTPQAPVAPAPLTQGSQGREITARGADSSLSQREPLRTPEAVGAEIRNLTGAARYLNVYYAVEIGRRLTEAKELVAHGEWLNWLKTETEFSQPTASRFMRVYAEYGADQGNLFGAETKYSTLNNLSVSNALRLLAVPEEEREEFALEVDAEHLSAKELEEAIRERDEAKKLADGLREDMEGTALALSAAEEERDQARDELRRLRQSAKEQSAEDADTIRTLEEKLRELESRPVDVAVQEPDPEEIERRAAEIAQEAGEAAEQRIRRLETEKTAAEADKAAAEAKVRAAEDKARAERDKLREKLKAAEEKLAGAGAEDRAEAEKLRSEVEALKKQIAMSGEELVTFRLRFAEWQEAYAAMLRALAEVEKLDGEKAARCAAAVRSQAEKWSAA